MDVSQGQRACWGGFTAKGQRPGFLQRPGHRLLIHSEIKIGFGHLDGVSELLFVPVLLDSEELAPPHLLAGFLPLSLRDSDAVLSGREGALCD